MTDRERKKRSKSAPPETDATSRRSLRVRRTTGERSAEDAEQSSLSSDVHPALDGSIAELLAVAGSTSTGSGARAVLELREQVIHAERLATIGRLAAGVVHELNNPLTSISVNAEHLLRQARRTGAPADDIEKLSRIVEASDRMLRFTRDLMTYARPRAETPRPVAIHRVVEQALVFCEHLVIDSGVKLDKRFAADLPFVHANEAQLHQVIINLVTNACHALRAGGVLIIETGERDDSVWVRVRDDGVGIPAERLGKIFEPFYSTKDEGMGTGLGLSIVRNIVTQHGGAVTVESREGDGSTFEVVLPAIAR